MSKPPPPAPLDTDKLLRALRALGEQSRLRVVALLARGELTVSELTEILGQSQPGVSRHLRILVEAGVLERFTEGSWAFFRLSESAGVGTLRQAITALLPVDAAPFARDAERLAEQRARNLERASRYFDRIAANWDDVRLLAVGEEEVEAAMLRHGAPVDPDNRGADGSEMLDLGTGTGRVLEIFAPYVRRAVGVDLSRDMLAAARAKLASAEARHCTLRQGDICRLDVPAGSHDLVTIHHVLHFLDDPRLALAEAARCLRPGGRLIVVDFAPHSHEFLREQHAHRRLGFANDEMLGWLADLGLEEASVEQFTGTADAAQGGPAPDDKRAPLAVSLWTATQHANATDHRRLEVA